MPPVRRGVGEVPVQPVLVRRVRRDQERERGDAEEGSGRDGRGAVATHHDEVGDQEQRRQLERRRDADHHAARYSRQRTAELGDHEQTDQHVDLTETEVDACRIGDRDGDEYREQHGGAGRGDTRRVALQREADEEVHADERERHPYDLPGADPQPRQRREEDRRYRWIGEREPYRRNTQ